MTTGAEIGQINPGNWTHKNAMCPIFPPYNQSDRTHWTYRTHKTCQPHIRAQDRVNRKTPLYLSNASNLSNLSNDTPPPTYTPEIDDE